MTNNIVRDGMIMMVMLFVIIMIYVFTSGFFDEVFIAFENINNSTTDGYIESGTTLGRTVYNMMFAGFGLIPIFLFIVRVFSNEPDWGFEE